MSRENNYEFIIYLFIFGRQKEISKNAGITDYEKNLAGNEVDN